MEGDPPFTILQGRTEDETCGTRSAQSVSLTRGWPFALSGRRRSEDCTRSHYPSLDRAGLRVAEHAVLHAGHVLLSP